MAKVFDLPLPVLPKIAICEFNNPSTGIGISIFSKSVLAKFILKSFLVVMS